MVDLDGGDNGTLRYLVVVRGCWAPIKDLLGPYNTRFLHYYCHYSPLFLLLCPYCPHIVIIVPRRNPLLLLLCHYIIIVMSALIIL